MHRKNTPSLTAVLRPAVWAVGCWLASSLTATQYTAAAQITNVNGVTITNLAIDQIQNKVLVAQSKGYATTPAGALMAIAGNTLQNDAPIYYQDISSSITAAHKALGFIDLMVTLVISDAPGVSGPGQPFTNFWSMSGDRDDRGVNDMHALGEGTIYEFIDDHYKPTLPAITSSTTIPSMTVTSPVTKASNGDYTVLRFAVPTSLTGPYNLYLGKGNVSPWPAGGGTGGYYQVKIFTPQLTNRVIPRIDIVNPSTQPRYNLWWDGKINAYRYPKFPTYSIPLRTPVTFSASNTWVSNASILSYLWNTGAGWVTGGPTYTASFNAAGTYNIYLMTVALVDGGLVTNSNYGSTIESGTGGPAFLTTSIAGSPDFAPAPLPLTINVITAPAVGQFYAPRPNPFIVGFANQVVFDYDLVSDTAVTVEVLNLRGDHVRTVQQTTTKLPPGTWAATWDGRDDRGFFVPEGVYYVVFTTQFGNSFQKLHVFREK